MNNWAKVIIGDSRKMIEVEDNSIDLVVTSPPYWHIKDYGVEGQIGYGQSLHEYLKDLYRVWKECYRILKPGRRLVINIGDQFARSIIYGRYKVIPLHAEFISQCEDLGFDYMGSIIWQKKTTMNTTGGANVMGSYPYPPYSFAIDYAENDRPQLEYLGFDVDTLKNEMIGLNGKSRKEKLQKYFEDMNRVMSEISRVLKAGKYAVIIIGSNDIQTEGIRLENKIKEFGVLHGLKLVREIRKPIKGIRNTMHEEFVLIFRKEG